MSNTFKSLRLANEARQAEWDSGEQISLAFRGNELAGEVGEALEHAVRALLLSIATGKACNIVKKLERENMGLAGSTSTKGQLAEELADIAICTDLIAMHAGIDLQSAITGKFNATSEKVGLQTRLDLSTSSEIPGYQPLWIDPVKNRDQDKGSKQPASAMSFKKWVARRLSEMQDAALKDKETGQ